MSAQEKWAVAKLEPLYCQAVDRDDKGLLLRICRADAVEVRRSRQVLIHRSADAMLDAMELAFLARFHTLIQADNTHRQLYGFGNNIDGDNNAQNDPSGGVLIINAGASRVSGFDIGSSLFLTLQPNLRAFTSVMDWKYLALGTPALFVGNSAFPGTAQGTAFRYAPMFTVGGSVRCEANLARSFEKLVLKVGGFHTSRFWFNLFRNDLDQSQAPKTIFNRRLYFASVADSGIMLRLFVQNILKTIQYRW